MAAGYFFFNNIKNMGKQKSTPTDTHQTYSEPMPLNTHPSNRPQVQEPVKQTPSITAHRIINFVIFKESLQSFQCPVSGKWYYTPFSFPNFPIVQDGFGFHILLPDTYTEQYQHKKNPRPTPHTTKLSQLN